METVDVISHLQRQIHTILVPFVPKSKRFALLEFPDHVNIGDSAIWLGTLAYFRTYGMRPSFVCTTVTPRREDLERALPEGPIFLQGGGNFGDLWPVFQKNREHILRAFPNRKIIQLPQNVHFNDPNALRVAAKSIADHPDFTLLVRDYQSFVLATDVFSRNVQMCPDTRSAVRSPARSSNENSTMPGTGR